MQTADIIFLYSMSSHEPENSFDFMCFAWISKYWIFSFIDVFLILKHLQKMKCNNSIKYIVWYLVYLHCY